MMALALLAVALKVMIPQGFMASDRPVGSGFPIVICTAHGQITLAPEDKPVPAKPKADTPCAFAGNITPPTPSLIALAAPVVVVQVSALVAAAPDQAPGRGLAAPPPPAIGPPTLL